MEEEYERQEVGKDNKEVEYCCEWNVEKSEYISGWETWRSTALPDNDKKCNTNGKKWQNDFEEEQESHQKRIEDMNERQNWAGRETIQIGDISTAEEGHHDEVDKGEGAANIVFFKLADFRKQRRFFFEGSLLEFNFRT